MNIGPFEIRPGRPTPLGATLDPEGVNFAVFSRHATKVMLCLFDEEGNETEVTKVVDSLQALDQAKLIPLLVKTIQELEARIKLLESK